MKLLHASPSAACRLGEGVALFYNCSVNMREQFERSLRITLLIFVLAAAGFLSAVTAIRIAIRGRIVAMPNLVGKSLAEAQNILGSDHLQLRVADRVYNALPANAVVRQNPPPGEQVKVTQDAQVVLSLGPQTITAPVLEGHSVRAARITLLEMGLQLGEVSTIYSDAAEPDSVLKQSPPPGETAPSPRVDLLVSGGPAPVSYMMPSLVGVNQQEADRSLTSSGLHVPQHTYVPQPGTPHGTVIAQTPPAGSRIDADAAVELNIAQ